MRKPQLADCPFGICKRLATKKSNSILWPPWKATRSLLWTHLLFRGNAFKNGVYSPCLSEHCTKCQSKTNGHDPGSSLQKKKTHSCKWIQDRLGFWIPRRDFRFQVLDSCYFFSRTWIPDSNLLVEFWNSWAVFWTPKPRIPDWNFAYSGIRIPLHGAKGRVIR